MEKFTLLANIGNRNLKFNGLPYYVFIRENGYEDNFKEITQSILEETFTSEIAISTDILDPILNEYGDEIDKILLFGSNNTDAESRNNQDTYYAAQLIVKDLSKKFPQWNVDTIELNCSAIDTNILIKKYRYRLRRTLESGKPIAVCDAGGTTQMKFALKTFLEFRIKDKSKLKFYEVLHEPMASDTGSGNSVVRVPETFEFRNLVLADQVRYLANQLEYRACLELLGIDPVQAPSQKGNLPKLLSAALYRKYGQWHEMKKPLNNLLNKYAKDKPHLPRLFTMSPACDCDNLIEIIGEKEAFTFIEYLATGYQFLKLLKYNEALLNLSYAYEHYLNSVISKKLGFNLVEKYDRESRRLAEEAFNKFPFLEKPEGEVPYFIINIPNKVQLVSSVESDLNQSFLHELKVALNLTDEPGKLFNKDRNANTLSSVRNKIAHEGLLVTKAYLDKHLPYLSDFYEMLFDMFSIEKDSWYLLNMDIETELYQ